MTTVQTEDKLIVLCDCGSEPEGSIVVEKGNYKEAKIIWQCKGCKDKVERSLFGRTFKIEEKLCYHCNRPDTIPEDEKCPWCVQTSYFVPTQSRPRLQSLYDRVCLKFWGWFINNRLLRWFLRL